MSTGEVFEMNACLDTLLAALDARNVEAIEAATAELGRAVDVEKAKSVFRDVRGTKPTIDLALRKTDAARMRVNIMSEWTERRASQLAELRGQVPAIVYANRGSRGIYGR